MKDILGDICNFYEKLFSSNSIEDNDINSYLKDCKINPLTENDKNICDSFPTLDECKDAVMNLKANKSPGFDGISNEFYQTFWKDISHLFLWHAERNLHKRHDKLLTKTRGYVTYT